LNAVKKQRNCHIKFAAYDDEVLIIGNGNQGETTALFERFGMIPGCPPWEVEADGIARLPELVPLARGQRDDRFQGELARPTREMMSSKADEPQQIVAEMMDSEYLIRLRPADPRK